MSFRKLALTGLACCFSLPVFAQENTTQNATQTKLFQQLDADGDGLVTADEVGDKVDLFDRLVKLGDANDDQKLTLEEFTSAFNRPRENQPAEGRPEAPMRRRGTPDPSGFFDRLDRDGDGKLTKAELPEGLRDRFEPIFEKAEKDSLTREEFATASREVFSRRPTDNPGGQPPLRDPEGLKAFFARMDQNEDGIVTKEEVPERASAQFEPLFEELSKDSFTLEEYASFAAKMQRGPRPGGENAPEGSRPNRGFPDFRRGGPPRGPAFFSKLDKDENGRLSPTELAFAVTLIEELDRNSDGELDAAELMGFRPTGPGMRGPGTSPQDDPNRPQRPRRPEGAGEPDRPERPTSGDDDFAKRFFERFDSDQDGSLSKSEAPERLAENFGSLDQNKDDKLSLEEFQAGVGPRGRRPND